MFVRCRKIQKSVVAGFKSDRLTLAQGKKVAQGKNGDLNV